MKDYLNLASKANSSDSTSDYLQHDKQDQKVYQPSENTANSVAPASLTKINRVYKALLSLLQNRRVPNIKPKKTIPFAFHFNTKRILLERDGWTEANIRKIENSIIRDVEDIYDYEIEFDAPFALYNQLQKENSTETIFESGTVIVPGQISNPLVCQKLLETFTEKELLAVPGFLKIYDLDGQEKQIESLRLDLDAKLSRYGFLMPVLRNGLIINLKVFRHPNDEKPFILRTRNFNTGGQNKW